MFNHFFKPVSIMPLVIFRAVFGLLILLESWGAILTGMVKEHYIDPPFTFPFMDFLWLQPLPGNGMYGYFILMGFFALLIMLGAFYRIAIIAYFLLWSGVYFMQKSYYNNHYYLLVLLCFLLIFVPANKKFSLDSKWNPQLRSDTCPQWCIWIFIAQASIVYFYAGIAKIYPDWLSGKAIETLFKHKTNYFIIGSLLSQKWFQYFIAYSGILFDLLIAPALLWRKTRIFAFYLSILFHVFNSAVFQIGIFPYMAILLEIFYFPPAKTETFFSKWIKPYLVNQNKTFVYKSWIGYVFVVWVVFQIFLPIRHWFYKGDVAWTEEGHRLSWRMMLRSKWGRVSFIIKDKNNNQTWVVKPEEFLTKSQSREVATKPDICWQFIQFLKSYYKQEKKIQNIEIYAISEVSLNGRPFKPLYNQKTDLTKVKWKRFSHSEWLNPMIE